MPNIPVTDDGIRAALLTETLIELRRKRGFQSQRALADALGVSQETVSYWERGVGQPTNENLVALAKILRVSVRRLVEVG